MHFPRIARRFVPTLLAVSVSVAVAAQLGSTAFAKRAKRAPPPASRPPAAAGVDFGAALPGLDTVQLADFAAGRVEFESKETPEGGLGPIFNDDGCSACHFAGASGGSSSKFVIRFGKVTAGVFDPLENLGGSLLQAKAIDPVLQEVVPASANVVSRRITTPLFGAGLIEAIPDADIVLGAQKHKPDGVKGRISTVTDVTTGQTRVGRFGWKAQHATLLAFAADAYSNEMGVTNRFFTKENAPNGKTDLLARFVPNPKIEDPVDPATGKADFDHAADFMRLLAPPPVPRATAGAIAGGKLFAQLQCTACHVPSFFTGASPVAALSHKPVPLYSDLLLHDMGRLGDGIAQGSAKGSEMRTAPLWGLRARPVFLHDGRAATVQDAIQWHDGEAGSSRDRFNALKAVEKQQVLEFLSSI